MAKMTVDSETCIGCGQCVAMFGDNFDFNEDGISTVKSQDNVVPDMVDICPVGAIKITEEDEKTTEENE